MMHIRSSRPTIRGAQQRAAVLLEVIVSMVIFVAASGLTLSTASNVLDGLDRQRRQMQAADIAASLLAELEAGLISINDLRDDPSATVGSFRNSSRTDFDREQTEPQWRIEISTERSEFEGLSLVTIEVREARENTAMQTQQQMAGAVSARSEITFTLRQLIELREDEAESYERDEMLEDLPNQPADGPNPGFGNGGPGGGS